MSIVDRAKNIILKPADEWSIIANESETISSLFQKYIAIIALGPIVGFTLTYLLAGLPIGYLLADGVFRYVTMLGILLAVIFIVNAIVPSFNGKQDLVQTAKVMGYSVTPAWLSCILMPIPLLGFLAILGGCAYTVYLMYLGMRPVLGVPEDKVAGITVVSVLVFIVTAIVLFIVVLGLLFTTFFGSAMMTGAMAGA